MNDETALVDAIPDGQLLADWAQQHDVGKTTTYAFVRILKAMGMEPKTVRKKGASKSTPFLEGQVLDAMNHLLLQHRDGKTVAALEAEHATAIVATALPFSEPTSNDPFNPTILLSRLQAADLAISTGLPLSKKELAWIVGVAETSKLPENTRIRIGRTSLHKWTLLEPTAENLIQVGRSS